VQVLISHLADIEAKLASIPVRHISAALHYTQSSFPPFPQFALTSKQAPSSHLDASLVTSPAESRFNHAPLAAVSHVSANTVEPVMPKAVVVESADAHAQSAIKGEGPVALALAAARDSRHRRAAAVAAAVAAATASLATEASSKNRTKETVDARAFLSIPEQVTGSCSEQNTRQELPNATEADAVLCASIDPTKLVSSAEVDPVLSACVIESAASGDAAAPPIGTPADSSSSHDVAASCKDTVPVMACDSSCSPAADDGIILWSRMDKDKKVHLNDFLANK
jgi:hypothetical protein